MSIRVNIGPDDWPDVLSFNLRQAGALWAAFYGGWETSHAPEEPARLHGCGEVSWDDAFTGGEPARIGTPRQCPACEAAWFGGSRSRCPFCALHGRPGLRLVP